MSKKIAVASVVALVLGGVAIPGGIFVNDMVADMTYGMVNDGLLGIQDEAGPIINEMVLHTFAALLVNTCLTDMSMDFSGFPIELDGLDPSDYFNNPETVFKVGVFMDLADLAEFMGINLGALGNLIGWMVQLNAEVMDIEGIAMFNGESLNFNEDAIDLILYGKDDLPGIITDIDTGSGMTDFIHLYESATTESQQQQMEGDYLCTWEDLTAVYDYVQDYLIGSLIQPILDGFPLDLEIILLGIFNLPKTLIDLLMEIISPLLDLELPDPVYVVDLMMPELSGLGTPEEIGEFKFFQQWANGSLVGEPGFPLPLKAGEFFGFEVGIPEPTNMSMESTRGLWDLDNPCSLVNSEGIAKWLSYPEKGTDLYNEIRDANGLTDAQMEIFYPWLQNFQYNLMPFLAQHDMDLPMDSISLGNLVQGAGIGIGALCIGLASTGFVSNRVVKSKAKKKTIGTISQKKPKKLPDIAGDAINPAGRELEKPAENLKEIPPEES